VSIVGPASPSSDGFTVLPNGNFLINNSDTSCTYNQYNPTTGALVSGLTITVSAASCTGVTTDGTFLYFQTNFNSFTKTDLTGFVIATKTVTSPFTCTPAKVNCVEDIDVSACTTNVTPLRQDNPSWAMMKYDHSTSASFGSRREEKKLGFVNDTCVMPASSRASRLLAFGFGCPDQVRA